MSGAEAGAVGRKAWTNRWTLACRLLLVPAPSQIQSLL